MLEIEPWKSATAIKVNPDSPQRPLRAEALRRGITVFVPTPRLRGGFRKLDPHRIPPDKIEEAASLSRGNRWSEEVALTDMPRPDAIVCGSVVVTRDGRRCGKGEGYSDLEFAILRELGHPPVPVATKGGGRSLTHAMALELAPHGIRVNAIAPGPTLTGLTRASYTDPERRRATIPQIPLGRMGQPEDMVGAILFLASDEALWVTGSTVTVDGGYLVQ